MMNITLLHHYLYSWEPDISPSENEEYKNMDPSLRCPLNLLKILRRQTDLSDPSIHVRYMEFRKASPSGFIGRKMFVVKI
jgi:hypothetical protein